MKKIVFAFFVFSLFCSHSFANITYTAVRGVGTGSVNLSITTDGSFGALSSANMVDWTIGLTDGTDSFTLLGPLSGSNSGVSIAGSALTATATDLLFDFDAGGTDYALFQSPFPGSGQFFWCLQTNGCFLFNNPGEAIDPRANSSFVATGQSGNFVIASVNAVPEPEIYAMMGLGLGLLGWVGRKKKLQESAAA
jgi:hypothetical protein